MSTEELPPPASRSHDGDGITVSFDTHRCPHAAERVRGLPAMSGAARRSWIQPAGASADHTADVVHRCPGGALGHHRTGTVPQEGTHVPRRDRRGPAPQAR